MKKTKFLALGLSAALLAGMLVPVAADDIPDAGVPDQNSLVTNKTATANTDGTYTITLEAYATGSKIVSSVDKDVPTDIVLVIDQSGSMDYCIVCGGSIDSNSTHSVYSEVTTISTSKTYYVAATDSSGNTSYTAVTYCNGKHKSNNFGPGPGGGGTTSCSGGAGWYTSTQANQHTKAKNYTPKTDSNPDGTQFYEKTEEACTSRLSSLKTAVTNFVNSVNTKAKGADGKYGTDDDVNHRIAVVGFGTGSYVKYDSYSKYENTELFIGSDYYNYSNGELSSDYSNAWGNRNDGTLASEKYSSAFQNMNTETGYKNVIASKDKFAASGATCVNLGIDMANEIFNANRIAANEERNRVMIVFTDGAPSKWADYSEDVANDAIEKAYATKNTHKATVYTIGVFSGANGSTPSNLTGLSDENKFMHLVSSNYLDATSMTSTGSVNPDLGRNSYYLSAGDSTSLNNIFEQIADQIESGGSASTLDSSAVVKDIIAPQFQLPEGATANDITLETWKCTGVDEAKDEYTWTKNDDAMGATATVNGDKVSVMGFDFSENWVGTETTNGNTAYRGNKLVIKFNVQTKDGFLGGNDVYTNTSAGVYENAAATEAVQTFNWPQVNVPIKNVNVTAADKNVYLLGSLTAEQIKSGATASCGNVKLKLNETNYGLESWQTEYVNINVTYTDKDGNAITDLSDLKDDTTYSVSVTVSPKTETPKSTEGEKATTVTGSGEGKINVFTPELTFKDSEVYYGDNAPTDYSGNYESSKTVWKHGDTLSTAVTMIGTAPALTLGYTPDATKIADGKINTKQDIPVDVTVKIGENDVTGKTSFQHTACTDRTETLPTDKEFLLHVKTCSLTITKAAGANTTIGSDEYFVFNVQKDGKAYTQVTVKGTGSVTISELPVGTYTVEEDSDTAWRYTSSITGSGNLTSTNPTGSFTCTNTLENNKWLNHFTNVINTYGKANNQ